MSTPAQPKQFLALTGEETMFQMTLRRTMDRDRFAAPIIVAGAAHADLVAAQLAAIGIDDARVILEPCARNTAPAIALAALCVDDTRAPMLVMPSDHVILDQTAFDAATDALLPLVQDGWLATYGITPTAPETGYGYIQTGDIVGAGVHQVARFVEKPDAVSAQTMIASGDHVWNGGIFLFRADAYLDALASFAPDMLAATRDAMAKMRVDGNALYPDADAFAASPADSIDYAVMEKAARDGQGRVTVVPVSMGWSDIGSWDALYDLGGAAPTGPVLAIDSARNLVRSDGINVHLVGIEDLIVVASGNDILILPRGQSQDVKKVVEALKAQPN